MEVLFILHATKKYCSVPKITYMWPTLKNTKKDTTGKLLAGFRFRKKARNKILKKKE